MSVAHRLGRLLEKVTRQSGRLPDTPEYGSWLLGKASESQQRRRVRIQLILTVVILSANVVGIGAALLLVTVAFPVPSVFSDAPFWVTWVVCPAYIAVALMIGTFSITRRTVNALRWAIEERTPTHEDQLNAFLAPWRVAKAHLMLWGVGTALFTTLYGLQNTTFIPRFLFTISFTGVVIATACYLLTEFALRPVAAQALEAGPPPRRLTAGIMGRLMIVWLLGSLPVVGIALLAVFAISLQNLTEMQFAVAVWILAIVALLVGFILMWIVSWLTATPVRVVRAALKHVEQGNLDCNVVVFDGTELGELQRGFNTMVDGLKERERVRDLFGRHVGREVAAAAEQQRPKLGGEERHVAVVFVDIIGSTQLVTGRPATEVVDLLNRFFAVIVEEVDRHHGLVNKFEGDAVAGNVGAKERFEYTVIGEPVNEAARLCELSKSTPEHLLASSETVQNASETECANWTFGDTVTLRGHDEPTRLALPV
jgi:adenylate cyclase